MTTELILKCRIDGRDCYLGSRACGFICAEHFPERAHEMNAEHNRAWGVEVEGERTQGNYGDK